MKRFIKAKSNFVITLWLFLFSALLFLSFSMADQDLFGHLKFGQTICESKSIPKTDMFSYTAYGLEWINHEWLAETVFWIFYKSFSDYGLVFLRLAAGLIFCFFLWRLVSSENIAGSIIAFLSFL